MRHTIYGILAITLLGVAGCQLDKPLWGTSRDPAPNAWIDTAASDGITQRFVIRSDTQYPRTDDSITDKAASERLIEAQDAAIKDYRSAHPGSIIPIFLNGDVTEYGHGDQREYMQARLAAMPYTYYGLGNHDYENNVNGSSGGGCLNNGCSSEMVLKLIDDMRLGFPKSFDKWEESEGLLMRKYHGSMSYSKVIGDFTFIQLNNHYNYQNSWNYFKNLQNKYFYILPSLDWLEEQLRSAKEQGSMVIINMHRSPTDAWMGSADDRERFKKLVNDYHVVAIFHGHTHNVGQQPNVGNVPVFQAGAAFKQTFLVAEYSRTTGSLAIREASANTINATLANIEVLHTAAVPAPEVISTTPGTLKFTPRQPGYDARPFSHFDISLNDGPYQRVENGQATFYQLEADTSYRFTIKATDTMGNPSPTPFSGIARTLKRAKDPRNLCLRYNMGVRAYWEPAEPNYWPMPFYFYVAFLDSNENIVQTIRGGDDDLRIYQEDLTRVIANTPEERLKQLDLAVAYHAGVGSGRSRWVKLPMKWLFSMEGLAKLNCKD